MQQMRVIIPALQLKIRICCCLSGGQGEEDHVQEGEEGEEDVLLQRRRALLVDRSEAGGPQRVSLHITYVFQ